MTTRTDTQIAERDALLVSIDSILEPLIDKSEDGWLDKWREAKRAILETEPSGAPMAKPTDLQYFDVLVHALHDAAADAEEDTLECEALYGLLHVISPMYDAAKTDPEFKATFKTAKRNLSPYDKYIKESY